LSIEDESDIQQFEDDCATRTPAPIDINFRKPLVQLPGFTRLKNDPDEWKRMTPALIDYTASMTNSEYQAAYTASRTLLLSLHVGNFTSVAAFGDAEEQAFAIFDAYAQDARRSTIDCLDRCLQMLTHLKTDHRRELDAYARKKKIPENAMDVHWVMSHLIRLEKRDQPEYSFWNKTETPAPAAPTGVALLPATTEDDAVTITCQSQRSPECEKTFTESTSRWLALKDPNGKTFQVPKSCMPCRKLKRQQRYLLARNPVPHSAALDTANLTVAFDIDPEDDIDPDDETEMADYASRFFDL
jgi:hypothetical protein